MEIINTDKLDTSPRLKMRLEGLSTETSHTIYKVPKKLRGVNTKSYEPEMIAIGPYHHGKDELKEMEELKLRYMKSLLARKNDTPLEQYLSAITRIEKEARNCYAEPIGYGAIEFTEMLVLDGCFIIELTRSKKKIHNDRTFPGLYWDLILLENQIPFFVLCELSDIIEGPEKHTLLMKRVLVFCRNVFPGNVLYMPQRNSKEVKHILDLIHSNWCPSDPHNTTSDSATAAVQVNRSDLIIPSAVQLKDSNVTFEKKGYYENLPTFYENRGTTVFDVEFRQDDGVMLMPTLRISDGTESLLRNLMAFEQFLPPDKPAHVTDYASLLDYLINTSKDVQILSQHGIIENILGSDQVVADFVNKLNDKIAVYRNNFLYAKTFNRINAFRKKRWNRAMAVYHRDYFNSPWAYVSIFAAFVLLLLTMGQTIFSALQQFT